MSRGPQEQVVFDTLQDRLAGVIMSADRESRSCFSGMFRGCRRVGYLDRGGALKIGKHECEIAWRINWAVLRDLGLIRWDEHGDQVILTITENGYLVHEDELRWFDELMAAQDRDLKASEAK